MFLGLGHGFGFNQQRAALSQLIALIQSLNGHIFAPGLETYADQAALNPAASALDSQVGYVGSASTQGREENLIANSEMVGATSSTLPPEWVATLSSNGVTATQTGKGVDADGTYLEFAFSGTAGGTNGFIFLFPNGDLTSTKNPIAYAGQLWSAKCKVKGISGVQKDVRLSVGSINGTSGGSVTNTFSSVTNGAVSNLSTTYRLVDAGTTKVRQYIQINVPASSGTWDQIIRIYAPQLERGHPTNYIPTYGTAISRGVFASAAQATLANTPKLVALGNARGLEFDGSTDHLVTDVVTPSSGYICVIGRQTADTSAFRAWLGSNTYNTAGVNIGITATGDAGIYTNNGTNNYGAITSGLGYVPGTLAIIDADWQPSFRSIRVNGGNEASSGTTADPATSACFILGGRNSATWPNVTLNAPAAGQFFPCIIIPNVTLPASTKQRIRKLVGQIYGVQTQ